MAPSKIAATLLARTSPQRPGRLARQVQGADAHERSVAAPFRRRSAP